MPSEELDQTSSEALAARFGGDRRGHGGRSAAEGRPSGPSSSTTCSCRTPAQLAATLPEARPRSFSTGARAATSSLQFFSEACRTLLSSRVPPHAQPSRCPRAGVALGSSTRRAFRAAQVECPEHSRTSRPARFARPLSGGGIGGGRELPGRVEWVAGRAPPHAELARALWMSSAVALTRRTLN